MTEEEADALLATARRLAAGQIPGTAGLWSRAAALLARQTLEMRLRSMVAQRTPGAEQASTRAQLLCLEGLGSKERTTALASHTWWALTRASHHSTYDLAPTADEIVRLIDDVAAFLLASTARPG